MRGLNKGRKPERRHRQRVLLAAVAPIAFVLLLIMGGHLASVPEIDPSLSLPQVGV